MSDAPRRPLMWWDLGYVGTLLLVAGLSVGLRASRFESGEATSGLMWLSLGVTGALLLLYLFLGRPALRRAAAAQRPFVADAVFLALLLIGVMIAVFVEPNNASMQAIAYPVIWTLVASYATAVIVNVVFATMVGCALIFGWHYTVDPLSGIIIAVLSFAFSIAMGTWITRIFERGERYRELSENLRDSQQQVAELSLAAGVAAERERLSRDLHDTLTQTLTGLVMLSEQAERALAADDYERAADRVARVTETSREAMVEARALVATTQPLSDGGLADSIMRVAERLRLDTGLDVRVEIGSAVRENAGQLDRDRQVVLLRAAQEGLSNARRHARANVVTVLLDTVHDGAVLLRVTDDGVGPEPAAVSGFGLSGLAERVRAVGGSVEFRAGSGGGAVLEVRVAVD